MMNYQEFIQAVIQEIEKLGIKKEALRKEVSLKNNGQKKIGLIFVREEAQICPVVYMESFYARYCSARETVDVLSREIYLLLQKNEEKRENPIAFENFSDWDKIKNRIFGKLVNADRNGEFLNTSPHRKVLDLALVYYVKMGETDTDGMVTVMIHDQHMKLWNRNEEDLYQTAMKNMETEDMIFQNILEILGTSLPVPDMDENQMYVLSTKNKIFGAVELLNRPAINQIAERLHSDLIILPSSIHELMILPQKDLILSEVAKTVKEINGECVSAEEYLSDHVYEFKRSTGSINIAA